MCADPRHPKSCQGPRAWGVGVETSGPGCGVADHVPGCLCDVLIHAPIPRGEK